MIIHYHHHMNDIHIRYLRTPIISNELTTKLSG